MTKVDYPAPEKKPGEDVVLDVTLDEPEAAPAPAEGVLDVTLEDEPEGAEAYPEVTETQQRAASNDVLLECLCSGTKQGFEVRFEEGEPGVYYAAEVTPVAKGAATSGAGKVSGLQQVQGAFRLGPEFACPCCGSKALSACEACGAMQWIARSGKLRSMALPKGWLSVEAAESLPEPDISWMSDPWPRTKFTGWMG